MIFKTVNFYRLLLLPFFFPYVGIIRGNDIQPFYLISLFLILLIYIFKKNKYLFPKEIYYLLLVNISTFICLFISLINNYDMSLVFKYIILVNTVFVIFSVKEVSHAISYKYINFVIITYLFVGVIQLFFHPDYLSFLIPGRDLSIIERLQESGRGVRSLASEPSAYGKVIFSLVFLSYLIKYSNNEKIPFYFISFLIVGIFTSQSFYASFFLLSLLLLFLLKNISLKYIFNIFILIFLLFFIITKFLDLNTLRFFKIFNIILQDPSQLVAFGAFRRLLNVFITLSSMFCFDSIGTFGNSIQSGCSTTTFLFNDIPSLNGKAWPTYYGGFVELIYVLGFFSLPIFFYIYYLTINNKSKFIPNKSFNFKIIFSFSFFYIFIQDGSVLNPYLLITLLTFKKYIYGHKYN